MSKDHQLVERSLLYRLVFASNRIRVVVFSMLLFFILQPVGQVYADETAPTEAASAPSVSTSEPVADPEPTPEPEKPALAEDVVDPEPEEASAEASPAEIRDTQDALDETQSSEVPEDSPQPSRSTTTVGVGTAASAASSMPSTTSSSDAAPERSTSTPGTTGPAPSASAATSTATTSVTTDTGAHTAASTTATTSQPSEVESPLAVTDGQPDTTPVPAAPKPVVDEPEPEVRGTSTEAVPPPTYLVVDSASYHSDNLYQFDKRQCIAVGDGSYHCFDETATSLTTVRDTAHAERDEDGDYEIFLQTNRGPEQLTHNRLDDTAPAYDPLTETVVWQRLEGGRHAIYTNEGGVEVRLSEGSINSMEPQRSGAYSVWQSWIDGNWEVVLYTDGVTRTISTSPAQDVAPYVQGEYVIWTTTNGSDHVVTVYEIATGQLSTISDGDGAMVTNPRFVLVYDSKFANGDIITKGYDTETGEVVPLSAQAPLEPSDIPPSDQTGETRALIQGKTQSREEGETELVPQQGTSAPGPDPVASSTDNGAAEAVQGTSTSPVATVDMAAATTTDDTLVLTDFDLIIPPYSGATSTHDSGSTTSDNHVE